MNASRECWSPSRWPVTPSKVREEVAELLELAEEAKAVEGAGNEAKLGHLRGIMQDERFFDRPNHRWLLFTEFKDTLDHLMEQLKVWGFSVGCIHGGMTRGSREEPGTLLRTDQQFRESAIRVLVATEAAGEGINLSAATFSSTTTSPGIPTGSNSVWAASTAMDNGFWNQRCR